MADGEKLELCRIKRTGITKCVSWTKQGGSFLWIRSSVMRVCYLFSALQAPDLLLAVWQDLVQFSGTVFGVTPRSWQGLFQVYQQILASSSGNDAVEWEQEVFLCLRLLLQPLPAAQLFCIDPIDFVLGCWYSPVALCLTKQSLLGTACSSVPSLLGSWSLHGPNRALSGYKCIWQQVLGRWWQCLTRALPRAASGVFHCWGRCWVFHK